MVRQSTFRSTAYQRKAALALLCCAALGIPGCRLPAPAERGSLTQQGKPLTGWLVCGPFPAPVLDSAIAPNEQALTPTRHATVNGQQWRAVSSADGQVMLHAPGLLGAREYATAFAFASYTAAEAGDYLLAIGSDDGVAVTVNGVNVWTNDVGRGLQPESDLVRARLRPGTNDILLKVHQRTKDWGFVVSLRRVPDTAPPRNVTATAHDSRIDLRWERDEAADVVGYNVYRATAATGPFTRITNKPHPRCVFSDFIGENGRGRWYELATVYANGMESPRSPVVGGTPQPMTDEQLLTSVQEAAFRYFWDHAHPVSGLAREALRSADVCTSGGTGFGLMALMVGADRGFVTRAQAADRVLKIVTFLQDKAWRFHGAWSHWYYGDTGRTRSFSTYDDGADIVETAFLVQGMLAVRQYFNRDDPVEAEIRTRVTQLWRDVEWRWFLREPNGKRLTWHWSPNHGWKMNLGVGGVFNECMVTYILAIASPTHAIPAECYYSGWVGDPKRYARGGTAHGIKQWVGWLRGGPLFFTHYSFLGFDPRHKRDRFCNYFENNRNITLMHRGYCIENPKQHKAYGPLVWGLTASRTPGGYQAHAPGHRDNGTIAPTAALSAMPYTPAESIATLKHLYHTYGKRLWGEFGFRDAFNPSKDWFSDDYLAIDQGPIVCMIENYRTGLCWRMFMANPEIEPALRAMGWQLE